MQNKLILSLLSILVNRKKQFYLLKYEINLYFDLLFPSI